MTTQTDDPRIYHSGTWRIREARDPQGRTGWQVLQGRVIKQAYQRLTDAITYANDKGARFPASLTGNLTEEEQQHHTPPSKTVRRSRKTRQAKR